MAKSKTKNLKRHKRLREAAKLREAQNERIHKQIRKEERKDITFSIIFISIALFLAGCLVYAEARTIILTFFS